MEMFFDTGVAPGCLRVRYGRISAYHNGGLLILPASNSSPTSFFEPCFYVANIAILSNIAKYWYLFMDQALLVYIIL